MPTGFPTPEDDDAEDVAWGLTTGAALWRQGERYDAIVWLKRAVEAATDAGASIRADELNRAATDLIASLAMPPQVPKAAAVKAPAPKPPSPRGTAPSAPSVTRPGAPVPPKPPPPPRLRTPSATPAVVDLTLEPTPGRPPMPSVTTSAPPMEALTGSASAAAEPAPEGERHEPPPPPSILPDIPSSMPTPAMPVAELEAGLLVSDVPPAAEPPPEPSPESPPEPPAPEPPALQTVEAPSPLARALDALPLTPEQKRALAGSASIESLASEEDVSIGCLALVIDGAGTVQAAVADVTAVTVNPGELLYARSSIADTVSLRIVAEADPTVVALWDASADDVLAETPEFAIALRRASDRIQAIAGCSMGPVGERLDEGLRAVAIERLEVRALAPGEVIAPAGQPVPGMVIVGVGALELEGDNGASERLGPGDFLFASQVLAGGPAPWTARAGSKGAIVLFGPRAIAHELLVTCPPLLEVLAGM
jgi:hypothetical protein